MKEEPNDNKNAPKLEQPKTAVKPVQQTTAKPVQQTAAKNSGAAEQQATVKTQNPVSTAKTAANEPKAAQQKTAVKTQGKENDEKTIPGQKTTGQSKGKKPDNAYDEKKDIEANKLMAALSYLLFFLPLVTEPAKTSKFARFHSNQGLLYLILYIIVIIITQIIYAILWRAFSWGFFWIFSLIDWLLYVAVAVLGIISAFNAYNGKRNKLPLIGKITIIKEDVAIKE